MSNKSQTVFAVCFGLFLAVVVTVSLLFADKLPHATQPEGITGGYLFSFNVECVDESGNLLKTQKYTGIVTDIERPRNKKYIYRIWQIYNDFDPEKKLEKLF